MKASLSGVIDPAALASAISGTPQPDAAPSFQWPAHVDYARRAKEVAECFVLSVDEPGLLAKVTKTISAAGINIEALAAYDRALERVPVAGSVRR